MSNPLLSKDLRKNLRHLALKLDSLTKSEAICCGITLSQCHILTQIGWSSTLSLQELADALGVDKSTMSRNVDNLVAAELVDRTIDRSNRRVLRITLTAKGHALFTSIEERMEAFYQTTLAAIPLDKQAIVIESLALLNSALPEHSSYIKKIACCPISEGYTVRPAKIEDITNIKELLTTNNLPTAGVNDHINEFYVAVQDDHLIGVIGLEQAGSAALFRSLAVTQTHRKQGIASALVNHILTAARQRGCTKAYLLTNTAAAFAARWGFTPIPREKIPAALLNNSALQTACPSSSTCMILTL